MEGALHVIHLGVVTESVIPTCGYIETSALTLKNFTNLSTGNLPSWYHLIISGTNCFPSVMGGESSPSLQSYLFRDTVSFDASNYESPSLWMMDVSSSVLTDIRSLPALARGRTETESNLP
jgi:hypothetical protein